MGNCLSICNNVVPIRDRGVRLEVARDVLNKLTNEHYLIAKEKLGKDPSPGEVIVHGYVKAKANGVSLAEYLLNDEDTAMLVGRCNVFLSHTWGTPFADTIDAVEEYEAELGEGSSPRYYFIDFFSINQFQASGDLEELGNLAQSCDTLVLFAKPWNRPATLERAWCIFEVAHGLLGGTELVVAMPHGEKALLSSAIGKLYNTSDATTFLEVFANINTSKMKASLQGDLDDIRDFIQENMGGFLSVDQLVSSSLRKWVGKAAYTLCQTFSPRDTYEHEDFLFRAGLLFAKISLWEYLLETSQQGREICQQLQLDDDLELFMNSECIALEMLGRWVEAVEAYKMQLNTRVKKYGMVHVRVFNVRKNFGNLLCKMKRWNEAEKEANEALEGFKKLQKPMSVAIRLSQVKLARILRDSGKDLKRAEQLFREMLDFETAMFGSESESFLLKLVEHARCIALLGDHGSALTSYTKALPDLVKAFGEESHHVKNLRMWISESKQHMEVKSDL